MSMADKMRKRRGRKCKENVSRTDGGRISRAANGNEPPDKLAKETRMRHYGVSEAEAKTPEAGTVIGRLKLKGRGDEQQPDSISENQYDALISYQMTRERYLIAIRAPDSLKNVAGGVLSIPDDDADRAAIAAWDRVQKVIRDAQCMDNGNLQAALQYLVVRDEYHPHLVGSLKVVANALFRFYGIANKSKSA